MLISYELILKTVLQIFMWCTKCPWHNMLNVGLDWGEFLLKQFRYLSINLWARLSEIIYHCKIQTFYLWEYLSCLIWTNCEFLYQFQYRILFQPYLHSCMDVTKYLSCTPFVTLCYHQNILIGSNKKWYDTSKTLNCDKWYFNRSIKVL